MPDGSAPLPAWRETLSCSCRAPPSSYRLWYVAAPAALRVLASLFEVRLFLPAFIYGSWNNHVSLLLPRHKHPVVPVWKTPTVCPSFWWHTGIFQLSTYPFPSKHQVEVSVRQRHNIICFDDWLNIEYTVSTWHASPVLAKLRGFPWCQRWVKRWSKSVSLRRI